MSIGNLSSTGKNKSVGGGTILSVINIPNTSVIPSKLVFLSYKKVENFSDFMDVLSYYDGLGLFMPLVNGEYVTGQLPNRYAVIDVFYTSNNEIRLSYRDTASTWNTTIIAYTNLTPSNWSYYNVEI